MANGTQGFGNLSMLDLYRIESEGQTTILNERLLLLEQKPGNTLHLDHLMRAAHSLMGAARMVDIDSGVRIAHAMEDCFVAAQEGTVTLGAAQIDTLLKAVDFLKIIASTPADEFSAWLQSAQDNIDSLIQDLDAIQKITTVSGAETSVTTSPTNVTEAIAPPAPAKFDPAAASMLELFRNEVDGQVAVLTEDLLALEQDPTAMVRLERLMRAAHSVKGAARMVNLNGAVQVAHAMEDCFVAAQNGAIILRPESIDRLLQGVDTLIQIAQVSDQDHNVWLQANQTTIDTLITAFTAIKSNDTLSLAPTTSAPQPPSLAATLEAAPSAPAGSVCGPDHPWT